MSSIQFSKQDYKGKKLLLQCLNEHGKHPFHDRETTDEKNDRNNKQLQYWEERNIMAAEACYETAGIVIELMRLCREHYSTIFIIECAYPGSLQRLQNKETGSDKSTYSAWKEIFKENVERTCLHTENMKNPLYNKEYTALMTLGVDKSHAMQAATTALMREKTDNLANANPANEDKWVEKIKEIKELVSNRQVS